jgi:hypothetical protein
VSEFGPGARDRLDPLQASEFEAYLHSKQSENGHSMLTTMRLIFTTSDVQEAVDQTVNAFGVALARACEREAPFEKIRELAFCFGVAHPVMPPPRKGRASYSRDNGIFFCEAYLDYDAWIGDGWADRVRAVAQATKAALLAVHKTRLAVGERSTLSRLIEIEAEKLATSPPDHLLSLKPVYASEDEFGQRLFIGFQPPGAFTPISAGQRVRVLQPSEVRTYVRRQEDTAQAVRMVKLYKRSDGRLLYREAWVDGEDVVEHVGACGERGSISQHPAAGPARQREAIDTITAAAKADGFKTIPETRLIGLVVGKELSGAGTREDLRRRHALEDFLNEVTGWLGLGHCDGGSSGSGSMEAFCLVVDYEIAAEAIARELVASPFSDFAVSRAGA